jgi:hypothetical protein
VHEQCSIEFGPFDLNPAAKATPMTNPILTLDAVIFVDNFL